MAKSKRKSAHKTTHRRHSRRISGLMNKDLFEKAAGAVVGFVGARMLSDKVLPTLDAKIKGAATIGIGLLVVPQVLKNKLGEGLALGFAVAGGEQILKSTGMIAGMSADYLPYRSVPQISGAGISETVGGQGISETVGSYKSYRRRRAEA